MTASRRGLALVLVLALVWGSNFLWIKVALDGLSPVQLTLARMAAGALVLALVVRLRSERPPTDRTFVAHITVAALVGNVLPYLLFAVGEQSVDSAMAGVLNATTPLWTVLVALAAGQERRPTPVRMLGLVIGFAGALLIAEPWSSDDSGIGGELACLAAAASYGVSYVYMARYLTPRAVSPFVLAYGQMIASTALLIPGVLVAGRQPLDLTGDVVAAIVVLGFVGTGLAYVINYALIARDGATVASTVTYLLPAVAVVLGALVLDESVTATTVVGTGVVLLGVALARHLPERPHKVL